MRYRSILRSFERRAPKPRPNILVHWVDGQTFHIKGDGPHESKSESEPKETITGDDPSNIPTGRKADRKAKK